MQMKKIVSDECMKEVAHLKENVIIYGAGEAGKILMERLLLEFPELSVRIAVTAKDGYPYYLLGRKVFCIEDLPELADKCVVIIAALEKTQEVIADILEHFGFHDVYGMGDEFYKARKYSWGEVEHLQNKELTYDKRYVQPYVENISKICEKYRIESGQIKQYIERAADYLHSDRLDIADLIIPLGNKCSLRCRDCNNLMPYFKAPKDLDVSKILHSLEVLSVKADSILKCELIGGEPFLSNNLPIVLDFLIRKENVYAIDITTNGTILPKKEWIPLLQNYKVTVKISDYGTLVDKQEIIDYMEAYDVSYEVLEVGRWTASGTTQKRGRTVLELQKIYGNCYAGYFCKTLYEDKLFACARASSLYALGCMEEQEFIEIKEAITVKEIKDFILQPYSAACDYCDRTENVTYVEPAVQLER